MFGNPHKYVLNYLIEELNICLGILFCTLILCVCVCVLKKRLGRAILILHIIMMPEREKRSVDILILVLIRLCVVKISNRQTYLVKILGMLLHFYFITKVTYVSGKPQVLLYFHSFHKIDSSDVFC